MLCTVSFGSPSASASSAIPRRGDRPDSSRRIAAARSMDWIDPRTDGRPRGVRVLLLLRAGFHSRSGCFRAGRGGLGGMLLDLPFWPAPIQASCAAAGALERADRLVREGAERAATVGDDLAIAG